MKSDDHSACGARLGKKIPRATRVLGMVNAVVPTDQLDVATPEFVDAIAAGPPLALSSSKRELDNAAHTSLAQALETEALAQNVNAQTHDLGEALMAYAERRPSNFSGK